MPPKGKSTVLVRVSICHRQKILQFNLPAGGLMLNCKPEQSSLQTPDRWVIYLSELFQDWPTSSSISPCHNSSPPHQADILIPFPSSHTIPHTIITSSSDSNTWDRKHSLDSTITQLWKYSCQRLFCKTAVSKQRSSRDRWALHWSRYTAKNRFPR